MKAFFLLGTFVFFGGSQGGGHGKTSRETSGVKLLAEMSDCQDRAALVKS